MQSQERRGRGVGRGVILSYVKVTQVSLQNRNAYALVSVLCMWPRGKVSILKPPIAVVTYQRHWPHSNLKHLVLYSEILPMNKIHIKSKLNQCIITNYTKNSERNQPEIYSEVLLLLFVCKVKIVCLTKHYP